MLEISKGLYSIGALDKDLRVFDIVMETEFGTTYNSYLLKTNDGVALFETVKEKFFDEYLKRIQSFTDLCDIKYIIVNHTEPDHAGSVEKLLNLAPNATVIGSNIALKYLKEIINKDFKSISVKDNATLQLGDKTLRFISVPNLHWPDTMYTYIEETKTLVSCDSFGAHYADDCVLKSNLPQDKEDDYISAYKYYFNMIMGPFKPFVLKALDKIKDIDIEYICPGHGLVLDKNNITKYMNLYKEWSTVVPREVPSVVIPYVSAYGYTEKLAYKIKEGIESCDMNIDVFIYDLVTTDLNTVMNEINTCRGLILGSPTILADALPPIWSILTSLNPVIHKGLLVSCFGSYGWSGEAVKNITERFHQLKFKVIVEPLAIPFKPSEEELLKAFYFGVDFANSL